MTDHDFYNYQSEASQIKTRIVTNYFKFWARTISRIVKNRGKKLCYFDLYSGPGVYQDGTHSTPLQIIEEATQSEDLCEMLITIFNDENKEFADNLSQNLKTITGYQKLKHAPIVLNLSVGANFEKLFTTTKIAPSFTFVDPFGYKGVTLNLLEGMLKDWGCDLLLFFSYNRINAAINNDVFDEHTIALFGRDRLLRLRDKLRGRTPADREAIILENFSQSMKDKGFNFVLPFTFNRADMKRVSHHLIFITKHPIGYTVMKQIMAKEGSEINYGVSTFKYTKSLSRDETPLLYLLERPLEELGNMLLQKFSGQTVSMQKVFEQSHIGTPYIEKNYKEALVKLETDGLIEGQPSVYKRRKIDGVPTCGNNVVFNFPKV